MTEITLLSASTSTSQTNFVHLSPGRWKIAVSFAAAEPAATIAIAEKNTGTADSRVVSKSGAAVSLTEADPAIEYASGGESIAITRALGTKKATVTATFIERGGKR